MSREITLIVHNVRSCHNVGSLLRTAEGLGVAKVYLTGYTPYPVSSQGDSRLPHIAQKLHRAIQKTALGAQDSQAWEHHAELEPILEQLHKAGVKIYAIEQAPGAIPLPRFTPPSKLALILGREVEGIEPEVLVRCDGILEIPMFGAKESFNVVQAAAMALYHNRFA